MTRIVITTDLPADREEALAEIRQLAEKAVVDIVIADFEAELAHSA